MERVAIALSFDVDADSSQLYRAPRQAANPDLSDLSLGLFGIRRGLPRILELLSEVGALGTFFAPGATVLAHSDAIREVARLGHEIAHHGHHHFAPSELSEADQVSEVEQGIAAIEDCIGHPPTGYRAPEWKLSRFTLGLLAERRFTYDSSLMADDRPYTVDGAGRGIVELPVHWALDDFPHLGFTAAYAGPLRNPHEVFQLWWDEVESAIGDRRDIVFCMHPEVIARGWIFGAFSSFVARLAGDERTVLLPCEQLAERHRGVGTEAS
jgi:peptidoglycan/xylan/chitin deacetylase (PgdA/CDA1 family)